MKYSLIILVALMASFSFAQKEKDPLHKRTFNITLNEVKDGQPSKKSISDELTFKDGKLFSNFLNEKFQYKWIKYRINKDSIYNDETDTEVRYLEVEASATDESNQTVIIEFNTVEWDIEGKIKITKNDKIKKYFEMVGREKGTKPKKDKKKREEDKPKLAEE
jgi:hypothetical protein